MCEGCLRKWHYFRHGQPPSSVHFQTVEPLVFQCGCGCSVSFFISSVFILCTVCFYLVCYGFFWMSIIKSLLFCIIHVTYITYTIYYLCDIILYLTKYFCCLNLIKLHYPCVYCCHDNALSDMSTTHLKCGICTDMKWHAQSLKGVFAAPKMFVVILCHPMMIPCWHSEKWTDVT